ncbi:uncharacterized protein [Aegilops tauschii subsp. strangulata]|uniref:uncharacterized protein n=1 Tax=Aegilops tauschii subsp. strangulata TaxID=200361 RepID=UPI003CC87D7C
MADDKKNKQLAEYSGAAKVFAAPASSSYPRFDRENFGVWKALMECGLRANELWDAVDPGGDAFKKEGAEHRKDRQAASAIYSVMPMDVLQHLIAKATAKEVWDTLKLMFEGHTRVKQANLQTLLRNYETLVMGDDESVDAFASRVATLVNRIRALGENLMEASVVRRFLRAAPPRYLQIVTAIEQCVDLATLSIDDLVGRYKAHDERMRYSLGDGRNDELVMLTKAQWIALKKQGGSTSSSKKKGKQRSARKNFADSDDDSDDEAAPPPRRKFDIRKVRCYNCGLLGHFKADCEEAPKQKALIAQQEDDSDMMLMCELVDTKDPVLQASAKETVVLREEKVCSQDYGSETRVDATDMGGDFKDYVEVTGLSANFAGSDAAIAACARPWRGSLCVVRPKEVSCDRKSSSKDCQARRDAGRTTLGPGEHCAHMAADTTRSGVVYTVSDSVVSVGIVSHTASLSASTHGSPVAGDGSSTTATQGRNTTYKTCTTALPGGKSLLCESLICGLESGHGPERKDGPKVESSDGREANQGSSLSSSIVDTDLCDGSEEELDQDRSQNAGGDGQGPLPGGLHGVSPGGLCVGKSSFTAAVLPNSPAGTSTTHVEERTPPTPKHLQPVLHPYLRNTLRTIDPVMMNGSGRWCHAMKEELGSIHDNNTWELVDLSNNEKAIELKWQFKVRKDVEGCMKHKVRFVAKEYVQEESMDFKEVFVLIAKMESVRLLIALAAQESWKIHHMDVNSAFLNGEIEGDVYVNQPPGFIKEGEEHKVLKLHKILYGLWQGHREWNIKLDRTLISLGFEKAPLEHAMYKRGEGRDRLLVGIYVDDLLITGADEEVIAKFKLQMKEIFKRDDLGLLSFYPGIEVHQKTEEITPFLSGFFRRFFF